MVIYTCSICGQEHELSTLKHLSGRFIGPCCEGTKKAIEQRQREEYLKRGVKSIGSNSNAV